MAKRIFMLVVGLDQDASGNVLINPLRNGIASAAYFSHRIDLKSESPLRAAINNAKLEIMKPFLEEGMEPLNFKTVPSLSALAGQIVQTISITLESGPMDVDPETKVDKSLMTALVVGTEISSPMLMTNPSRSPATWPVCEYGKINEVKDAFRENGGKKFQPTYGTHAKKTFGTAVVIPTTAVKKVSSGI